MIGKLRDGASEESLTVPTRGCEDYLAYLLRLCHGIRQAASRPEDTASLSHSNLSASQKRGADKPTLFCLSGG